jgi:hypothetical protein
VSKALAAEKARATRLARGTLGQERRRCVSHMTTGLQILTP